MNAWDRLPNATHIDRVLASLSADLAAWGAARGAAWDAAWGAARGAARGAAWDAARDAAWGAARGAAWDAARGAARGAAWDAARGAARGAAWDAAWDAARGAVMALVAWDACAVYLTLEPDALRLLYAADPTNYAAYLLLPASIVFSKETS